jgi:hypothetical protein
MTLTLPKDSSRMTQTMKRDKLMVKVTPFELCKLLFMQHRCNVNKQDFLILESKNQNIQMNKCFMFKDHLLIVKSQ